MCIYCMLYVYFIYCDQVDWSLKPGRNVTFVSLMLKKPNVSEVQIQGISLSLTNRPAEKQQQHFILYVTALTRSSNR